MEAELLRGMISDRDDRIANIKRKQEALIAKEERLKEELSEAAETNSSQIITQQTEKTALFHDQQGVMHQLHNLHQHLQRQGESLNEFVMYIQQNGEVPANDTQSLMRLQAQLCKAMHSMSIVDRQHNLQKDHLEKLLKFQKEELAKQSEDKAHLERSILNDLMERDTEVRGVENELKKELDVILKEMNAIRDQLEDSDDEEDDEDKPKEDDEEEEEEELDEEERAAKEEMMKLLQQRKEEIEKLEKDIEEREELIEELQMRAGEEPPSDESPRVSATAKKQMEKDEKDGVPAKEESPKKEEKKEEPVDEMAARLQQVMASASDTKVDEVDEMDLLKLAQSRLTGGGDAGGDDDDDDEEEEDSDDEEETEEFDEDDSEGVDNSEKHSESAKVQGDDDYDPTEKKEDPIVES